MFYQLLKQGKKITVQDKNGEFYPTKFYIKDCKICYDNNAIGLDCINENMTARPNLFESHIATMLESGFQVVIE